MSAAQDQRTVPIVEVAFAHGKWWSMPQDLSETLYQEYESGRDAIYTWNWGEDGRAGSWTPNGERTSINRYVIDFAAVSKQAVSAAQPQHAIRKGMWWSLPVDIPASIATGLISPLVSKLISTTSANVPFESYGYGLKMWNHNSQVKCLRTAR